MSFSRPAKWGGLFALAILLICVVLGYIFGFFEWKGTGLSGKTLWQWLDLLIVPAALAVGVFLLNRAQSEREQASAEQHAQDAALQAYLDNMGNLLVDKRLSTSQPDEGARTVARARTLTVLSSLSPNGKRNVLQFLYESSLIDKGQTVVLLQGANLSGANLSRTILNEADLSEAILSGANLGGAVLRNADLSGAMFSGNEALRATPPNAKSTISEAYLSSVSMSEAALSSATLRNADLREADLSGATLAGTDLSETNLSGADLSTADLRGADLRRADLREASLRDASLSGARLSEADLRKADLRGASLGHADLRDANLREADVRGAELFEADLSGADVHGANWSDAYSVINSSRASLAGAGWLCGSVRRLPFENQPFSWLNPLPLWQSRNQVLERFFGYPTNGERRRWLRIQEEAGKLPRNLIVNEHADLEDVSFLVLGNTGEGDASQYAVVKPLLARGQDTDFMVICGGVIYPAGDIEDYEAKFYRPYKDYPRPIYAVPGNHDWYDDLGGFMYHLCGAEALALVSTSEGISSWKERLRLLLWRKPARANLEKPPERWRTEGDQRSSQRSPYFAIETGPLLVVGIDAGMGDAIDREQGEWLKRVSQEVDKPKLLLTGKPIYVDGEYHPGAIEGGGTVDEVVRTPEHRYVAVIGGGVHNYQRYTVNVTGRSTPIWYIVSGGGGAYVSTTHKIPKVELPGVDEDDLILYPRRGDSLSFYSKLYDRRFGFGKGLFAIPPDEAAAYMAERLATVPTRPGDRQAYISKRTRRAAERIFPLSGRGRGSLHHYFSEFFNWDEPPLFKNFLRVDASKSELRIRCFGVTGCLEHEESPPVEDEIRIWLGA